MYDAMYHRQHEADDDDSSTDAVLYPVSSSIKA